MELKNSEYLTELQTALEAAEKAGDIIDQYARDSFDTEKKEDGTKVTEADIASQEKIVEVISEEFPEDGFLGEEEHLEPEGEDRVWVIDPIDGTFNFDHGFQNYCVSIALEIDGETMVGLVYSPEISLERTYFAVKGEGAFKMETGDKLDKASEISVCSKGEIENSIFFTSCFDIYNGELEAELEVLQDFAERSAVQRQLGSFALEACRIAEGSADFQINPIVSKWDYAAAGLIIEEAGGKLRARESRFPDSREVIASNGNLQKEVEEIVGDRFQ